MQTSAPTRAPERRTISATSWVPWAAAVLSAALLELPFPLAGPLPAWRTVFAWFGLVPLICAVLSRQTANHRRPLARAFLVAYLCGVLWYAGNCYWIYATMHIYGGLGPVVSVLLLAGFSLVLGAYFGLFGLGIALVRRATGSVRPALLFAPFLWAALDLAAARITSVPWDQLGYSQVDNALVNQLAPWTGVYGITFLLVLVNALIAGGFLQTRCPNWLADRRSWGIAGAVGLMAGGLGMTITPPRPAPTASAVLVQPNLDVATASLWLHPGEWSSHIAQFAQLAGEECKSYIAGIPQTGAPQGEIVCPPNPTHPDLVVWPESPAPFEQGDRRFTAAMESIARQEESPVIVGGIGFDYLSEDQIWREYNSAMIFGAQGQYIGRYDKIHLVPFGEYVPFDTLLFFAHKLTGRVSKFDRGVQRQSFLLDAENGAHRYGIFICYEDVFADEVRQFARHGAQVFVNISDDGWYGDTSAPWQHLNEGRMRAIENRRWILRDTNTGITAVIDPYGRVRESIPRHAIDALPAQFAYRSDITFYTAHGDVFAWLCAILSIGVLAWFNLKPSKASANPPTRHAAQAAPTR